MPNEASRLDRDSTDYVDVYVGIVKKSKSPCRKDEAPVDCRSCYVQNEWHLAGKGAVSQQKFPVVGDEPRVVAQRHWLPAEDAPRVNHASRGRFQAVTGLASAESSPCFVRWSEGSEGWRVGVAGQRRAKQKFAQRRMGTGPFARVAQGPTYPKCRWCFRGCRSAEGFWASVHLE